MNLGRWETLGLLDIGLIWICAQLLTASYLNGANGEELNELYETVSETQALDPWVDSPGEISLDDWRDYLGRREYAYVLQMGEGGSGWLILADTNAHT